MFHHRIVFKLYFTGLKIESIAILGESTYRNDYRQAFSLLASSIDFLLDDIRKKRFMSTKWSFVPNIELGRFAGE